MCETETPEPEPEPELKDYTCQCTYVAVATGPNAGEPNKEETTTVKAEDNHRAGMECSALQPKYNAQFFQGTCLLQ